MGAGRRQKLEQDPTETETDTPKPAPAEETDEAMALGDSLLDAINMTLGPETVPNVKKKNLDERQRNLHIVPWP